MRVVRYQVGKEAPEYGWLNQGKVGPIQGELFGRFKRLEATTPVGDVRLLAPCVPSKIVCVGRNYIEHAKELGNDVPKIPLIFLKPPSSILDPEGTIVLPMQSQQVEHEAELVAVVGKRSRHITAENARKHILGYTVGNDVTARDLQKADDQWTRAKGFDTFCPFGPWIDTTFDPSDAVITCKVNGQPRQMASTQDLVFEVPILMAYISSVMTLEPGDLIFTGTPAGVGTLKPGDEVVVEIEGLGVLKNSVSADTA
jgi:2-keto-4-pentenoate hydratase/2-oxohepta-3-ene-1,7-dioic acid hydratase in catechol pathway